MCVVIIFLLAEGNYLKDRFKKGSFLLLIGLAVGMSALALSLKRFPSKDQVVEIAVEVAEVEQRGNDTWSVAGNAAVKKHGHTEPSVVRINNLCAERLPVKIVSQAEGHLLFLSDNLEPEDLLVLEPGEIQTGQAVAPIGGLDEVRLINLTLEAGMAAAMAEDLQKSVRFLSPDYHDNLGFDLHLMRELLERAYEEFDEPRIELAEPPKISVNGSRALVQAKLRLTATYHGYRNYLLGDHDAPDNILLILDKSAAGWKVSKIEGLRPLGFEEDFLKLLGGQVGLPLTEEEQIKKQQFCMPCRERMYELFPLR